MMRRPPDTASTNGAGAGLAGSAGSSSSAKAPFTSVDDRVQQSIDLWARDLRSLFEHARDRFGDVSWEAENSERIWAHKAVVYVRAPKAFKDRYFLSNKSLSRSPTSFSHNSPYPASSLLSATSARNTPSPSFFRGSTLSVDTAESDGTLRAPTLSAGGDGVLHLGIDDSPELFLAQLEWLYTGEGFGDVVEWINKEEQEEKASLSLSNGGSVRDSLGRRGNLVQRRDKLGQDLTYMWTSKLYCDVRIHLESPEGEGYSSDGSEDSDDSLASTVIFTAHRFMLVSRSPYFSSLLLNLTEFRPPSSLTDVHLPTPPFTPAALHFCLGWIYAGHLAFSNRSFDLLTAFQIYRSADYLQLDALTAEVESRLVYEFCHGLEWAKCHCRKCLSRVPRVWRFACSPDVAAMEIQSRARRFILTGWAECWNREVGLADQGERDQLVADVVAVLSPSNLIIAFRGIGRVKGRMESGVRSKGRDASSWVDALGGMIEAVEARTREILVTRFDAVCESADLWDLVFGKGFNDDVFDLVLKEVVDLAGRPATCVNAPKMYQTLVSSVLLNVHPETLEAALPTRSVARHKIETAKDGVLKHIRRRWMQIKDDGGFAGLETWALKEISDEIEVPIDDLLARQVPFPGGTTSTRPSARAAGKAPARTPRTSDSSRASTVRSPVDSTSDHPNGLRRLRLSSSASTSSVMSSRSTAARPASSARREPTNGPTARSPTAASKTPIVSVGAKGRASTSQTRPFSPTPTRAGQVMTGPPRPLLTGKTAASKVASNSGTRRQTASPGPPTSTPTPAPPLRHRQSTPVLNSRKSTPTLRHQTSMASVKSASSVRTATTARTSISSKSTATATSSATAKSAAAKVATPSPRPGAAASRSVSTSSSATKAGSSVTSTSTKATTASSGAASTKPSTTTRTPVAPRPSTTAKPAPKTPTTTTAPKPTRPAARPSADGLPTSKSQPTLRTRTLSGASTKSRVPAGPSSPAPALPPGASATARSASATAAGKAAVSRTPVTRSPATTTKTTPATKTPESKTPALRSTASSKSLSRVAAAKPSPTPSPKTPAPRPRTSVASATRTPTTPSDTLQTPPSGTRTRSTSLNTRATPPSGSRLRTTSAAAPWKRATPLPPQVAGVRQPRKSIRSSSGSTEGPQEAITPRVSNATDHIIMVEDNPMLIVSAEEPDVKEEKERVQVETDSIQESVDEPGAEAEVGAKAEAEAEANVEAPVQAEPEPEVAQPPTPTVETTPALVAEQDTPEETAEVSHSETTSETPLAAFEDAPGDTSGDDASLLSADASSLSVDIPVTDVAVDEPTSAARPASIASAASVEAPVETPAETSVDAPAEPTVASAAPPAPVVPTRAGLDKDKALPAAPVTTPVRFVPTVVVPADVISPSQFMDAPSTPRRNSPITAMDVTPRGTSTPPTSLYTESSSVDVTPTNARHHFVAPRPQAITAKSEPTTLPIASQHIRPPQRTLSPPVASRYVPPPVSQPQPRMSASPTTPPVRSTAVFGSPIAIPGPPVSSPPSVLSGSPRSVQSNVAGSPLSAAGSPLASVSRIVSDAGSTRSQTSPFRHHPARAFDPPPRKPATPPPPLVEVVEDDNVPFSGTGMALNVGIPCIVTLSQRRARFRANVKYLGRLEDEADVWVGLETDDLERFGVETLSTGAKGGVRYFHFTKSSVPPTDQDAKNKRQRRIAAIADSLPSPRRRYNGLGLAGPGLGNALAAPHDARRAASPFVADWAPPDKPRALFVRPHEVVFVMGAE